MSLSFEKRYNNAHARSNLLSIKVSDLGYACVFKFGGVQ